MTARIVVFGATGYTGRLVAEELVAGGVRPVLAGRDADRLDELAAELGGGLDVRVADAGAARTVADLVDEGDVLVATVGPFVRWGQAAAVAAVGRGATYVDSTGEPEFVRQLQERVGTQAAERGVAMVPSFGYDYVPGNLAGALALDRAGPSAHSLDVTYFAEGQVGASGGTAATSVGMMLMPSLRYLGGRLVDDRLGARTSTVVVDGRERVGVAVGGTEHLFLPPLAASLQDVGVYLGWFGDAGRLAPAGALLGRAIAALPGAASALASAATRFAGSTGGPDAAARAETSSLVVAEARDRDGAVLTRVELVGPDPYTLTGRLLAWAATSALAGELHGSGVLGPVQAFGLKELAAGCAGIGLVERADRDE